MLKGLRIFPKFYFGNIGTNPFRSHSRIAQPAMRCGSEPLHRIDPRGMLDARALCILLFKDGIDPVVKKQHFSAFGR